MGKIMRRHWIAACLSEEVAEPDGAPVRCDCSAKILSFFATAKAGSACSTNTARIGARRWCSRAMKNAGLRCLYHGWKFDVDGNVVEMASEPADSLIPDRVKHKSYPAREAGGFVWAYMGPAEKCANSSHRRSRRPRTCVSAPPKCECAAIGRRFWKARSTPRIPPACIRPTWCRPRSKAPRQRKLTGCGHRPTRRRDFKSSAPATDFATPR